MSDYQYRFSPRRRVEDVARDVYKLLDNRIDGPKYSNLMVDRPLEGGGWEKNLRTEPSFMLGFNYGGARPDPLLEVRYWTTKKGVVKIHSPVLSKAQIRRILTMRR